MKTGQLSKLIMSSPERKMMARGLMLGEITELNLEQVADVPH